MKDELVPLLRKLFDELPHPALLEAADRLEKIDAERIRKISNHFRLALKWIEESKGGRSESAVVKWCGMRRYDADWLDEISPF